MDQYWKSALVAHNLMLTSSNFFGATPAMFRGVAFVIRGPANIKSRWRCVSFCPKPLTSLTMESSCTDSSPRLTRCTRRRDGCFILGNPGKGFLYFLDVEATESSTSRRSSRLWNLCKKPMICVRAPLAAAPDRSRAKRRRTWKLGFRSRQIWGKLLCSDDLICRRFKSRPGTPVGTDFTAACKKFSSILPSRLLKFSFTV
mmetsp:Transcript_57390/g.153415  ORF Transcript_57390/g.153415 Transcript_57390/m.153415 type:complete len:201 (-) Transcript_57390:481-1083(-)